MIQVGTDPTRSDAELAQTALAAAGIPSVAPIVFGIVLVFVQVPGGGLIYAIAGLVIFAGLTMFDFQRLRRTEDIHTAPFREPWLDAAAAAAC
jgi:FtsH-binding integral membrane protein